MSESKWVNKLNEYGTPQRGELVLAYVDGKYVEGIFDPDLPGQVDTDPVAVEAERVIALANYHLRNAND